MCRACVVCFVFVFTTRGHAAGSPFNLVHTNMSWFSSLTKLQIAVAIAVVLDVVVTVMLFVYGVIADPNFISNDVKHYSFYTSLLDVVVRLPFYVFVRCCLLLVF